MKLPLGRLSQYGKSKVHFRALSVELGHKLNVERIVQYQDAQRDKSKTYVLDDKDNFVCLVEKTSLAKARLIVDQALQVFLPKGYPDSVANGYISFVQYSMLSAVLSSAGGVLSMQALLHAVGLGAGAIPLAGDIFDFLE
jgi:hypothetical protein